MPAAPLASSPATPSRCAVGERTTEGRLSSTVDLRTAALDDRDREVKDARVCGVLSTRFEQSWLRERGVPLSACSAQPRGAGPVPCLLWGAASPSVLQTIRLREGQYVCLWGTLLAGRFRVLEAEGIEQCVEALLHP